MIRTYVSSLLGIAFAAAITGCGSSNNGGGSGGSAGSGGSGGNSGDSGACPVNSNFQGQPGNLWVEDRGGAFAVFDAQNGALLKSVTGPGSSSGVVGGNGMLWLWNINNDRKVTPMQTSGQALAPLDIDPIEALLFSGGSVWTFAFDANIIGNVYKIADPTTVQALPVGTYTANAYAVSSDGFFFLGANSVMNPTPEIVAVDPSDMAMKWKLSVANVPALAGWPLSGGQPQMVAIPDKVFVLIADSPNADMFSVDTTTQMVTASGKLGTDSVTGLMTDGKSVFAYDTGLDTLYEVDQTTLGPKRSASFHTSATSGDHTAIDNAFAAAGAVWLQRICGDVTYARRVDIATFTVADLLVPSLMGLSIKNFAYLAP
jgi:hypothetical protein